MARRSEIVNKKTNDELMIIANNQVLISFEANKKRNTTAIGQMMVGNDNINLAYWGNKNRLPSEREILISNNNIVPQLIATKRNIILGSGLMAFVRRYEDGKVIIDQQKMPGDAKAWLEDNEIEDEYLPIQAKNLIIHGNTFNHFIQNGAGETATLKAVDCKYTRAQKQNAKGRIPSYLVSGKWDTIRDRQSKYSTAIKRIPNYQRGKDQSQFILQCADKLLGGPYYYMPHWEGATSWIKTANCIPEFHLANIKNGYVIRYIIRVPEDYYLRSLSEANRKSEKVAEFEKKAKDDFKRKINSFFAGAENAGRALIVTTHLYQKFQTEFPGLQIEPLEVNLHDEAMLKLFESSNSANTSSHGTPPALAGIATGAKMTSGSEIRNLYNFYQISAAPAPRRILMKPINMALRGMLKDDVEIGFIDVELKTTDENKSGKQNVVMQ